MMLFQDLTHCTAVQARGPNCQKSSTQPTEELISTEPVFTHVFSCIFTYSCIFTLGTLCRNFRMRNLMQAWLLDRNDWRCKTRNRFHISRLHSDHLLNEFWIFRSGHEIARNPTGRCRHVVTSSVCGELAITDQAHHTTATATTVTTLTGPEMTDADRTRTANQTGLPTSHIRHFVVRHRSLLTG